MSNNKKETYGRNTDRLLGEVSKLSKEQQNIIHLIADQVISKRINIKMQNPEIKKLEDEMPDYSFDQLVLALAFEDKYRVKDIIKCFFN